MGELIGRMLLRRYRIDAFLGRGGMAQVYKAWDVRRSVPVAIKVLNEDLAEDYVFLRRFAREARALELLQHPNIVRFFGFEDSSVLAFLVMEYIDGITLRRYLRLLGRPLTMSQVLYVFRPICAALHYAHEMGVFHRDIKPGNIFLERGGRVVLADFGIARLSESTTVTYSTPGTPAYMAPEQCQEGQVDARTDVYSLGITAYEMLTLDRPFKGDTVATTGSRRERVRWEQMHAPPPRPRSVNPGISQDAEVAILKALEKEPRRRQRSALEFYQDLSGGGAGQPASSVPWIAEPEPPPPPPSPPDPVDERPSIRRFLPVLAMVGFAIGIAALFIYMVTSRPRGALPGTVEASTSTPLTLPPPTPSRLSPNDTQLPPSTLTPTPMAPDTGTSTPAAATATRTLAFTPTPTSTPTSRPTDTPTPPPNRSSLDLVTIPAGGFVRGSGTADIEKVVTQLCPLYSDTWCRIDSFEDELPGSEVSAPRPDIAYIDTRDVYLDSFQMARHEVTNAEYALCVQAGVCTPPRASRTNPRGAYFGDPRYGSYPVVYVTWVDAQTYCGWVGARLPTAAEWEKAARGTDGRWWPWGDETPNDGVNFRRPGDQAASEEDTSLVGRDLAPVGSHTADVSPYGVMDMAGNVMEWVDAWYGPGKREIRGGSWNTGSYALRTAGRTGRDPQAFYFDVGFRCASDAQP